MGSALAHSLLFLGRSFAFGCYSPLQQAGLRLPCIFPAHSGQPLLPVCLPSPAITLVTLEGREVWGVLPMVASAGNYEVAGPHVNPT